MKTQIFMPPYNNILIDYCVQELKNGNIGIFPTDTVYGIGCDSLNIQSLKTLYDIKHRNLNKPICVLVSDINMVNKFVKNINHIEKKLIENFWPGKLTIIFDRSQIVPDLLTSNLNTIGIRMPNNKLCLKIIREFGNPLAMTSANISDKAPNKNFKTLLSDFDKKVSFIINDENSQDEMPSTIVRVENDHILILREGSITKNDILKCFGGNINVR